MSSTLPTPPHLRLASLDAYRGFVMLVMASSGLAFSNVVRSHPEWVTGDAEQTWSGWLWRTLAYQFDHVAWGGCAFWDLIQPSFMFMVGVALPFSAARRAAEGDSAAARWFHTLLRSFVLVALGVFLSSNGAAQTNFTYVNVLTQIGLGYPLLYLLNGRARWVQFLAAAVVLGGYGAWFARTNVSADEDAQLRRYVTEVKKGDVAKEFDQYAGLAAHWNKHTNPAATVDRWLLNVTPRDVQKEPAWEGRSFWVNGGGYQTLNFIPSLGTMIFGLMTGVLLRGDRSPGRKISAMLFAGLACFVVSMGLDTSIWPMKIAGCDWIICPIVKRIWTPTWALFSTGWTLWMLAAFYYVIDVRGWRAWSFPLIVVGMNSIAMYCLAQLIKGWVGQSFRTHLTTVDLVTGWSVVPMLFEGTYGPILQQVLILFGLWLICWWMYRQRIFVKV
jgi:heparan-alpha-glucosaminide N-acetyltransferase